MSNLDIESFIDLLASSKLDTTELSDILWLAKYMKTDKRYYTAKEKVEEPSPPDEIERKETKPKQEVTSPVSKDTHTRMIEESSDDSVSLFINNNSKKTNQEINIAHKGYFDDTQQVSRYLIDFKDKSFSKRKKLFDEIRTINYKANTGILNPFFKAKKQKLYILYIFIDYSSSMKVWKEMTSEYSKLLSSSGIFKSIKHVYINSDNEKTIFYKDQKFKKVFSPKEITNFHNNKLIFVLTDMLSKGWKNGDTLEVFTKLYKSIPLYVVQMLPYRLWRTTALKKSSITTLNSTRRYPVGDSYNSEIDYLLKSLDINSSKNLKLPIVSFDLAYLKVIGKTLRAKEDNKIDGAVFNLENIQENEPTREIKTLSGQEKVEYFFANASPKAQELAKCLSAVQFNLPIMRMIQEKVLKESSNICIAEVINSGLVNSSSNILEFNDDVCDVLYKLLGRERALEIAYKNSDYIQKNLGAKFGFKAYLSGEVDLENIDLSENDKKFATISCRILKSMGGEYAKLASCIGKKKEIIDVVIPDSKRFYFQLHKGDNKHKPIENVTINYDFDIAQSLVTFEEYDLYCNDMKIKKPYDKGWGRENRPVINITWHDAVNYCVWLSEKTGDTYRLPSEVEWEYVCRAGTDSKWSFGDNKFELKNYAWFNDISKSKTQLINQKQENPWGLYDTHGNVWEWCLDDWSKSIQDRPKDGMEYLTEEDSKKVIRGGSWYDSSNKTRSIIRDRYYPSDSSNAIGFRLLRLLNKQDNMNMIKTTKLSEETPIDNVDKLKQKIQKSNKNIFDLIKEQQKSLFGDNSIQSALDQLREQQNTFDNLGLGDSLKGLDAFNISKTALEQIKEQQKSLFGDNSIQSALDQLREQQNTFDNLGLGDSLKGLDAFNISKTALEQIKEQQKSLFGDNSIQSALDQLREQQNTFDNLGLGDSLKGLDTFNTTKTALEQIKEQQKSLFGNNSIQSALDQLREQQNTFDNLGLGDSLKGLDTFNTTKTALEQIKEQQKSLFGNNSIQSALDQLREQQNTFDNLGLGDSLKGLDTFNISKTVLEQIKEQEKVLFGDNSIQSALDKLKEHQNNMTKIDIDKIIKKKD